MPAAALHLGLTGWVANNWDGSVTLEAQGERAASMPLSPSSSAATTGPASRTLKSPPLPVKEHEYGFEEQTESNFQRGDRS